MLRTARFSVNVSNLCKSRPNGADLQRSRVRFSHEAKNSKMYVIKIPRDSTQSIAKKEPLPKLTQAELIDNAVRYAVRAQIQLNEFIDKLQLDKRLVTLTKARDQQVAMFNEKVLPVVRKNLNFSKGRENLSKYSAVVKQSDAFVRVVKLAKEAFQISCKVFYKLLETWKVFMQSEMRMKMQTTAIRLFHTIKTMLIKFFQFVYECYFQKPKPRATKKF